MDPSAQQKSSESRSILNEPIWVKILSFLPPKDVLQAMRINKRTCSLIRSNWNSMQKTSFYSLYLEFINDMGSVLMKVSKSKETCECELFSYEIDPIPTDQNTLIQQKTNVNTALKLCLHAVMQRCTFEILELNGLSYQFLEVLDTVRTTRCHIEKITIGDTKNSDEESFMEVPYIDDIIRFSGCTELVCSNIAMPKNIWGEYDVMQQLNSISLISVSSASITTKQLLSFRRLKSICFEGENDFSVNTLNALIDQWFKKEREIVYIQFIMCTSLDELFSLFDLISIFKTSSLENRTYFFLHRNKDFHEITEGDLGEILQVCIENCGDEYEQEITFTGIEDFSINRTLPKNTTL